MSASTAQEKYLERKVAGLCTRCGKAAEEDSSLCRKHRKQRNKSAAASMAKKRATLRADGLCIYNCGARPAMGGYACLRCRHKHNRYQKMLVALGQDVKRVVSEDERQAAIAAATRKDPDGRTRYHGQQRRGQQTYSQLNAQDMGMARGCFEAFGSGVDYMGSPAANGLHRGEREELKKLIASQGERCSGHIDDILERLGHFVQKHGPRGDE